MPGFILIGSKLRPFSRTEYSDRKIDTDEQENIKVLAVFID